MAYAVSTPVFEGPFDVLLHLITKQQVELYEVSISTIVDEFLAYLDDLQKRSERNAGSGSDAAAIDLDTTTQFLLIAATLVQLKAQRLLPGSDAVDIDDDLALWEERDLLLGRLVECKTFKDAALALVALENFAKLSYPRRAGLEERYLSLAPDPLSGVSPTRFRKAFLRAVAPKPPPPKVTLDHVTQVTVSLHDVMSKLLQELPRSAATSMTYRALTQSTPDRMTAIVYFLSLLELYKQGVIELQQATTFGELQVRWLGYPDDEVFVTLTQRSLLDAYEG